MTMWRWTRYSFFKTDSESLKKTFVFPTAKVYLKKYGLVLSLNRICMLSGVVFLLAQAILSINTSVVVVVVLYWALH